MPAVNGSLAGTLACALTIVEGVGVTAARGQETCLPLCPSPYEGGETLARDLGPQSRGTDIPSTCNASRKVATRSTLIAPSTAGVVAGTRALVNPSREASARRRDA